MDIDLDRVNDDGLCLLHVLAKMNEPTFLKCIMEKIKYVDPIDTLGQTPLHIACSTPSLKTAKLLLQYGADVNATTQNGNTPMMILSSQKHICKSFFKLLLDFNAKRDMENKENMRAVDIARMNSFDCDVIKLLQPL